SRARTAAARLGAGGAAGAAHGRARAHALACRAFPRRVTMPPETVADAPSAFHEPPVLPAGFTCAARSCGLKEDGRPDLALFFSAEPAQAAAVFTRNRLPGAPILV